MVIDRLSGAKRHSPDAIGRMTAAYEEALQVVEFSRPCDGHSLDRA
jgi:hypothetical protein